MQTGDRVRFNLTLAEGTVTAVTEFEALVQFPHGLQFKLLTDLTILEPVAPVTLSACSDCLDVVAGNTDCIDADREGEITLHINGIIESGFSLHPGDRVDEFSARPCELCGSTLAGERHAIAVIEHTTTKGAPAMNYPINEHVHSINGVSGRMGTIHAPQDVRGNMVHRNQTWKSEARNVTGYGAGGEMRVKIRFDDECQNGHQSFSITADVITDASRRRRDIEAGGCLHDEIAAAFPELAPLIKWHLMSCDGPMHYIANTVYHASDCDSSGRRKGEPSAWRTVVYFGTSPVAHAISGKFAEFIKERAGTGEFRVVTIQHGDAGKTGAYQFGPKYTFAGFAERWHECPFNDEETAQQWAAAFNTIDYRFDRIITEYSNGKARDLDAARSCAVWPDATDEELSADKETLTAALAARLPGLIAEFRADVERAGFLWEPSQGVL